MRKKHKLTCWRKSRGRRKEVELWGMSDEQGGIPEVGLGAHIFLLIRSVLKNVSDMELELEWKIP